MTGHDPSLYAEGAMPRRDATGPALAGMTVREAAAGSAAGHDRGPTLRRVPQSPSASVEVRLAPSLFRMSAAGRLAVAVAFAAAVWLVTLSVIG